MNERVRILLLSLVLCFVFGNTQAQTPASPAPGAQAAELRVGGSSPTTLDGASLPEREGPRKIVAPHDKRPARRVRVLKTINVVRIVNQTGH